GLITFWLCAEAAFAAASCASLSVTGGGVGSGVPDSARILSSSVGTSGMPAPTVLDGSAAGVSRTISASCGTRTRWAQPGQGRFSPACDSSHLMCWPQDGQLNFKSLIN